MTENDTLDILNAFERKHEYLKFYLKQTLKYSSVREKQLETVEFHNCEGNYGSDDF
jgi:hypothetical protein